MKRTIEIIAHDKDRELTVRVQARITSKNGLTRDEVDAQARSLARSIASDLGSIPYSDFGIENTRVRV